METLEADLQDDAKSKLEDLESTVNAYKWNAWELEFIEDMAWKVVSAGMKVSPKQYEKICELWEKI